MRVSERFRYWIANNRVAKGREDNVKALTKLSSQRKINTLHDDPVNLVRSMKAKDQLRSIKSYKDNVDFSKGFLDVSESAISSIQGRIARAFELAMNMANDTYDADNRKITSKEIRQIIDEVVQLGNSRYGGKFVFSGFRNGSPALSVDGGYMGDDGQLFLEVGDQEFKKVNVSGRDIFEANKEERQQGHFNLIDSLQILYEGLKDNDKDGIYKAVDELQYQMDKASRMQANVGAIWSSINAAEKRLEAMEGNRVEQLSKLQDVDVFKATSDFKRTESVLQSTLMATNKLLQPSLLNFMQ